MIGDQAPDKGDELRAIKDELVQRIADQQRVSGVLPDVGAAERFLESERIIRRAEVDHAEKVRRSAPAIIQAQPDQWQERQGKDGDGGLTGIGRVRGVQARGGLTPVVGPMDDRASRRRLKREGDKVRRRIRAMAKMPEYQGQMRAIVCAHAIQLPNGSMRLDDQGTMKLLALWTDAAKKHGDPTKAREKRIQVG